MACLSWKPEHTKGFVVAANPIYPVSDLSVGPRGSIEFEVLESDAELLKAHVGTPHAFYINDDTGAFNARLGPLVRVTSTVPALSLMRGNPTLRGSLEIIDT